MVLVLVCGCLGPREGVAKFGESNDYTLKTEELEQKCSCPACSSKHLKNVAIGDPRSILKTWLLGT